MLRSPLDTPAYRFIRFWLPALLRMLFGMKVEGTEHVPPEGPVVVASNHMSNVDPIFVGSLPQTDTLDGKIGALEEQAAGAIGGAAGSLPGATRRGGQGIGSSRAEHPGLGRCVGHLPEGHRQRSGRLGQPAPGVGLFSSRPGVVTIPVVITGTNRLSGPQRRLFPASQ